MSLKIRGTTPEASHAETDLFATLRGDGKAALAFLGFIEARYNAAFLAFETEACKAVNQPERRDEALRLFGRQEAWKDLKKLVESYLNKSGE